MLSGKNGCVENMNRKKENAKWRREKKAATKALIAFLYSIFKWNCCVWLFLQTMHHHHLRLLRATFHAIAEHLFKSSCNFQTEYDYCLHKLSETFNYIFEIQAIKKHIESTFMHLHSIQFCQALCVEHNTIDSILNWMCKKEEYLTFSRCPIIQAWCLSSNSDCCNEWVFELASWVNFLPLKLCPHTLHVHRWNATKWICMARRMQALNLSKTLCIILHSYSMLIKVSRTFTYV